jgi:hypothetical protein
VRAWGDHWFVSGTERSEREGLFRFRAAQFLALDGLRNLPFRFTNSNAWLSNSRADFVTSLLTSVTAEAEIRN